MSKQGGEGHLPDLHPIVKPIATVLNSSGSSCPRFMNTEING